MFAPFAVDLGCSTVACLGMRYLVELCDGYVFACWSLPM